MRVWCVCVCVSYWKTRTVTQIPNLIPWAEALKHFPQRAGPPLKEMKTMENLKFTFGVTHAFILVGIEYIHLFVDCVGLVFIIYLYTFRYACVHFITLRGTTGNNN